MEQTFEVDRSNITNPPILTRFTSDPRTLLGHIEAAIALGCDWHVECVYIDENHTEEKTEQIKPVRRHRLTVWAPVDKCEMCEALVMLAGQRRARAAHPSANVLVDADGQPELEVVR